MKKIIISGIVVIGLGIVLFALFRGEKLNAPGDAPQVACSMEAKLCPDGSAVGRSGPKCEFAPCPTGGTNTQ